jgi:hypothetical protein
MPAPSPGGARGRAVRAAPGRPRVHGRHAPGTGRGPGSRHGHLRTPGDPRPRPRRRLRRGGPGDQRRAPPEPPGPGTGPGPRSGTHRLGTALAPARHPGRAQGQPRHGGPAHDRGVLPAPRLPAPGRRVPGAAPSGRGRDRARQGQPERVRLRRRHELPRRAHLQPARPHAHAVRIVRRHRCRRGRRLCAPGPGDRHGRIRARPLVRQRDRRPQAHARAPQPRRASFPWRSPSTRRAPWCATSRTWPWP